MRQYCASVKGGLICWNNGRLARSAGRRARLSTSKEIGGSSHDPVVALVLLTLRNNGAASCYSRLRKRLKLVLNPGVVVLLPTMGGSVPLGAMERSAQTRTITVPIANYDHNQHSANENVRLQNL